MPLRSGLKRPDEESEHDKIKKLANPLSGRVETKDELASTRVTCGVKRERNDSSLALNPYSPTAPPIRKATNLNFK